MKCPRCDTPLKSGRYENEAAMLCYSCSGVMLKQRTLTKVLDRLSTDFAAIVDVNSTIQVVRDKGPIRNCPQCRGVTEYYGYMEGKIVMVDFCSSCNWLWIDSTELQAITKMYVQFQKVKTHIDLSHRYAEADIVGTHMVTEAVAKAFLVGFVI